MCPLFHDHLTAREFLFINDIQVIHKGSLENQAFALFFNTPPPWRRSGTDLLDQAIIQHSKGVKNDLHSALTHNLSGIDSFL